MKQIKELKNGVKIHQINDQKFQAVYASLKISFKMESYQNTVAHILSQMMSDRLESHDTKTKMAKRMDLLYGTKISSNTYSMGSYQVIDLSVVSISQDYVKSPLLQDQTDLLADMLYQPLLNQSSFEEACKNLKLLHSRIKDNPAQYAVIEAFKEAGKGQTFEMTSLGNIEDLDKVTLVDVIAFHDKCIHEFHKEIYMVGPQNHPVSFDRFELGNSQKIDKVLLDTQVEEKRMDVKHKGNQTELVMLFETDINPLSHNYAAYLVYIAHLGQLPSSLLFQVVREEHSLCYSIYAARQIFDGIFYIATGINDKNIEKTLELINQQLDTMKSGKIDIEAAKKYLVMQMEGVSENQKAYASHDFRNALLGIDTSVEAIQEAIENVSLEAVVEVAQSIKPGFVYAYRGENNEEAK